MYILQNNPSKNENYKIFSTMIKISIHKEISDSLQNIILFSELKDSLNIILKTEIIKNW